MVCVILGLAITRSGQIQCTNLVTSLRVLIQMYGCVITNVTMNIWESFNAKTNGTKVLLVMATDYGVEGLLQRFLTGSLIQEISSKASQ